MHVYARVESALKNLSVNSVENAGSVAATIKKKKKYAPKQRHKVQLMTH
jgi:hypothetical protein